MAWAWESTKETEAFKFQTGRAYWTSSKCFTRNNIFDYLNVQGKSNIRLHIFTFWDSSAQISNLNSTINHDKAYSQRFLWKAIKEHRTSFGFITHGRVNSAKHQVISNYIQAAQKFARMSKYRQHNPIIHVSIQSCIMHKNDVERGCHKYSVIRRPEQLKQQVGCLRLSPQGKIDKKRGHYL